MNLPRFKGREQGSMLILALIVLTLLFLLGGDIASVALVEHESSVNACRASRLEWALHAGFEVAKANLIQDALDTDIDSPGEAWTEPIQEDIGGTSAQGLKEKAANEPDDTVKVFIEIEDEESKWPLGLLVTGNDAQIRRRKDALAAVIDAFREDTRNRDVEGNVAERTAEAIAAFMARRDGEGGLVPRPETKSPLHVLNVADLALIPEVDDSLFVDDVDEDGNLIPGLNRFLTLWSYDLRVNVNTAPLAVLRGLFRADDRLRADDIARHRETRAEEIADEKAKNPDRPPSGTGIMGGVGNGEPGEEDRSGGAVFEKVADVQKVEGFTTRVFTETQDYMTVNSRFFSIWITAEIGSMTRMRHWIVRREPSRIVVVMSEAIDPDYRPRFRRRSETEEAERERGADGRGPR